MTTRDDLVSRLRRDRIVDARLGYTCSATALELEAATALEAKDAEIARLKAHLTDWTFDRAAAQSRISDLERQLAEEKETP